MDALSSMIILVASTQMNVSLRQCVVWTVARCSTWAMCYISERNLLFVYLLTDFERKENDKCSGMSWNNCLRFWGKREGGLMEARFKYQYLYLAVQRNNDCWLGCKISLHIVVFFFLHFSKFSFSLFSAQTCFSDCVICHTHILMLNVEQEILNNCVCRIKFDYPILQVLSNLKKNGIQFVPPEHPCQIKWIAFFGVHIY